LRKIEIEMNLQDPGIVAKAIIDSNMYMVLGTADESGEPWTTPVYFGHSEYREFYWISSPEVRHSCNVAVRPEVSIVVFNSQIPVGKGQAVYMSATAEEIVGNDFDRGLDIYNGRFSNPAEHGILLIAREDV
jgi:general stress protein 26